MGVMHQIVGKHCDWSAVHPLSYLNKSFESFQILALVKLLLLEVNTRVSESSGTVGDLLMESDDWLISRFQLAQHIIMDLRCTFEAQLRRENRRSKLCWCRCSPHLISLPLGPFGGRSGTGLGSPT